MVGDREISPVDDELTQKIIRCIIQVHSTLGPGFLESVYRKAMLIEGKAAGLRIETEKEIAVRYQGVLVGTHRLDLLVEAKVIVELKTVEALNGVHYAQIRSYLKAADLELGLLVNFSKQRADYRRVGI